jgi:hypothetical protein
MPSDSPARSLALAAEARRRGNISDAVTVAGFLGRLVVGFGMRLRPLVVGLVGNSPPDRPIFVRYRCCLVHHVTHRPGAKKKGHHLWQVMAPSGSLVVGSGYITRCVSCTTRADPGRL